MGAEVVKQFQASGRHLNDLDARVAATIVGACSDIALIMDEGGIVRDVALGSESSLSADQAKWVGRPWSDTVTIESKEKVDQLLHDAGLGTASPWRQVNHPIKSGLDVPVRYSTVRLKKNGRILALGRDMAAIAGLQQQLVQAQLSVEHEYADLRQSERRYRVLYQVGPEPVVILDASKLKIVDANPAVEKLLGIEVGKAVGKTVTSLFATKEKQRLQQFLSAAASNSLSDEEVFELARDSQPITLSASLYRQDRSSYLFVRLACAREAADNITNSERHLLDAVQHVPDSFVVTDSRFQILACNNGFLRMVQLASDRQCEGQNLDRWVGRSNIDLSVLSANLGKDGSVRNFATIVRDELGSTENVDITAVAFPQGEESIFGLTLRSVVPRPIIERPVRPNATSSMEHLTKLVGQVPLKDLVRETTDMIERLCIEAALELTGDNRASAAEVLGLSRQGLYAKLRRHGLDTP